MNLFSTVFIRFVFFFDAVLMPSNYHRLSRELSFLAFQELLILLLRYSGKLKFVLLFA